MKTSKKIQFNNKQRAFSIVELMIAILIGLIILTGLVTVFDTSQRMNRTQNGLARIQENGRYALSIMKQQIEQTGYQYCIAESNKGTLSTEPRKLAWNIQSTNFLPGFTDPTFDPAYLLFGHECNNVGTCTPSLTTLGADTTVTIPGAGTSSGDRISGTDVLTVRYLRGIGREIGGVVGNTINFTAWAASNPPAVMPASGQVILVDCTDSAPTVLDIATNSAIAMTVNQPPPTLRNLAKAFNLQNDFVTITYYVANNQVDGRDIPTLYSITNGVVNTVIEGVDAFDVVYGVKDITGATEFLTADEVQSMPPASCWPAVQQPNNAPNIPNATGCGWRSVVSIELHMLLNTIYNSASKPNEQFRYSQYGNLYYDQSNLLSPISHYNMHRREFFTAIALKNIMH